MRYLNIGECEGGGLEQTLHRREAVAERPWMGLPRVCESPPPYIQSNVIQYANFAFKAVGFNNMIVCNPFFDAQTF